MPKQVYIYGDSLLKATMPDEGYHYHFHYDERLPFLIRSARRRW